MYRNEDLWPFIPQRPPFVLVDALIEADDKMAKSEFQIPENHVMVEEGHLLEGGIVENMAQTCALHAGHLAHSKGQNTPLGFIAGIKSLKIVAYPVSGNILKTVVKLQQEIMNMSIATAAVHDQNDNFVASCEFRIFIKDSD